MGGTRQRPILANQIKRVVMAIKRHVMALGPLVLILFLGWSATAPAVAANPLVSISIFPNEIRLTTKQDRQSVVVQAAYADGVTRDVTTDAKLSLKDASVAKLSAGSLVPVKDGTTELTAKFGGKTLKVPIQVEQSAKENPVSFKLDVIPVLTKAGCNSGGCHGASRGKDHARTNRTSHQPGDSGRKSPARKRFGRGDPHRGRTLEERE
jgi:hypothetical protein